MELSVVFSYLILQNWVHEISSTTLFTSIDCKSRDQEITTEAPKQTSEPLLTFDVLVVTPPAPDYFSIENQIPGLCMALVTSRAYRAHPRFQVRLYNYQIKSDALIDFALFNESVHAEDRNFIGILGPDLDILSNVLISSNTANDLSFISYSQTSNSYRDYIRNNGNVFRIAVPLEELAQAYGKIFEIYSWKRAAILYQSNSLYIRQTTLALYDQLSTDAIDTHVTNVHLYSSVGGLGNATKILGPEGLDHRIFVLLLEEESAARVVCEFYRQGMYGKQYALFGLSFWDHHIWESFETNCTYQELLEVLDYSFYIAMSGLGWNDSGLIGPGIPRSVYHRTIQYTIRSEHPEDQMTHVYDSGLVSDALWSLLKSTDKALDSLESVQASSATESTTQAPPNEQALRIEISKQLKLVSFAGASGPVSFDSSGKRTIRGTNGVIFQRINGAIELAVKFKIPETIIENNIQFEEGYIPNTNREFTTTNLQVLDFLVIIPAFVGIVFCIVSATVYIVFRDKPAIKLISPKINVVCAIGSSISFSAILGHMLWNMNRLITIDGSGSSEKYSWGCIAYDVLLRFGYFVAFSCLVAKLYRVYKIFGNNKPRKKVPTDLQLMIGILVASACQLITNTVANIINPPKRDILNVEVAGGDAYSHVFSDYFLMCQRSKSWVNFVGNVMDTTLLLSAIYFSWMTRKVKVTLINESHKISAMVVTVVVLETLRFLTKLSFNSNNSTMGSYFTETEETIFIHWVIIGQVFFPGMLRLIRKPNWKPTTSVLPMSLNTKADIKRCIEDVANINGLEHLLNLHVKTLEMWSEMKAQDEVVKYLRGNFRRRSNSETNLQELLHRHTKTSRDTVSSEIP
ncbi:gamma-aminobutyric acid type B receptor subunit 2-like [Symsagittifera roscoffensis]|uniref:gamma-aminobutyric acid type B receptor subunit 2-like n=1 Tax=Symsagittifera roscoffensis TaxID=84072 RepID=UPI00307C0220